MAFDSMSNPVTAVGGEVEARRGQPEQKPAATKKRVALAAKSQKTSPGSDDLTKSPMPGMVPGQTLCAHFKKGVCKYGDRCRFLHTPCRHGDECKDREKGCPFGHARLKRSRRVTVPEDIKSLLAKILKAAEEGDVECSLLRKISLTLHALVRREPQRARERDPTCVDATKRATNTKTRTTDSKPGKAKPASKPGTSKEALSKEAIAASSQRTSSFQGGRSMEAIYDFSSLFIIILNILRYL